MKTLDRTIKAMNSQFFTDGKHGVTLAQASDCMANKEDCLFLDVRSEEELNYLKFKNVKHIPLNQLPNRFKELPDNCTIIVFCTSGNLFIH